MVCLHAVRMVRCAESVYVGLLRTTTRTRRASTNSGGGTFQEQVSAALAMSEAPLSTCVRQPTAGHPRADTQGGVRPGGRTQAPRRFHATAARCAVRCGTVPRTRLRSKNGRNWACCTAFAGAAVGDKEPHSTHYCWKRASGADGRCSGRNGRPHCSAFCVPISSAAARTDR